MPHKPPYTCPRCGYMAKQKGHMQKHLYNLQKDCPAIICDIELTSDIKECILTNRIYHIPRHNAVKSSNDKRTKITRAMRIVVWNTYIGEEIGKAKCVCCQTTYITQHNFHCGHVVANANGGKACVDNLRPICAVCNSSMGTVDMRIFALDNFSIVI